MENLYFDPSLETPTPGSLLDRYQQGEISTYAVNWGFLCGLDVANQSSLDDLAVIDADRDILKKRLRLGVESTRDFIDDASIYQTVKALAPRATGTARNHRQQQKAILSAIRARLAWSIAARTIRQIGYPVENLPLHLWKQDAATRGAGMQKLA